MLEALRAGRRRIHRIVIAPGSGSPGLRALESAAREAGVEVSREQLGPLRAVAEADRLPEESFEDLLSRPAPRFLVGLDRVTDVGNLGSIARSAEVAGVRGLVLEHRHAPPLEPGALRASAGALEHLPVGRSPRLSSALDLASKEGLLVLGADPEGPPISEIDPERIRSGEIFVIFGSEDRGLRVSIRDRLDHRVGIPLAGRVASLGVAAAAAHILLRIAEIRRSERARG